MLDAASPGPTVVAEDTGLEPPFLAPGSSAKLPPTDSIDRVLLAAGSRLVYSLTGLLAMNAFSPLEEAWVIRPTGGATSGFTYGPIPPSSTQSAPTAGGGAATNGGSSSVGPSTCFPFLPDFGADALDAAAALLRALWARLPLLRSAIAHAMASTALCMASQFGPVSIQVTRAGSSSAQLQQSNDEQQHTAGATVNNNNSFIVQVPDEVVQARYCGMLLDRLDKGGSGGGFMGTTATWGNGGGGFEHRSTSTWGGLGGHSSSRGSSSGHRGNRAHDGRAQGTQEGSSSRYYDSSDGDGAATPPLGGGPRHPLVASVEQRMRGAVIRRVDGIILGSVDVEEYDETLI